MCCSSRVNSTDCIVYNTLSLEQSVNWEPKLFSASQEIPCIFWNLNVYYCFRHPSLFWARSIQSLPDPTFWRAILILSSHLCLGLASGLFPSCFLNKTLYAPLLSPIHTTCPAHIILLDLITQTILGEEYRSLSSPFCSFLCSSYTKILSTAPYSQTPSAYVPRSMWVTRFHTHTKQQEKL